MMKNLAKRFIPAPLQPGAGKLYRSILASLQGVVDRSVQAIDWLQDKPVPPKEILHWYVTRARFRGEGERFRRFFVELCALKPHERVLDVGCGAGRMAIPLTKYLSEAGGYDGLDAMADQIAWARQNITSRHPNFHFQIADVYSKYYNPAGKYKAFEYTFPYESACFDLVNLASVFTHMLPEDMENYLSEIARVLKTGGRCLITYFLLNEASLRAIRTEKIIQDKIELNFPYEHGNYRLNNEDIPEAAVAYDETFIAELYRKYNLSIREPIHYGFWCKRPEGLAFQDIIVAVKN